MIPFLEDLKLFKDLPDMYATCQQFLDLGGGDHEEHAILLANFFQYIDDKLTPGKYVSYLVYGIAMPEGKNIYVLRKRIKPLEPAEKLKFPKRDATRDIELWSPLTGECFFFQYNDTSDTLCGI